MNEAANLPQFDNPPVIEVMHGVRFRRVNFDVTHFGHFHDQLKDRYPRVQTVPQLPPDREYFGDPRLSGIRFEIPLLAELPRAWFVSSDDTMLVQLQSDRLLLNWRAVPEKGEYPHFVAISAEFQEVFETLMAFTKANGLGALEIDQCEMSYINHMGKWPRDAVMTPHDWIRGWSSDLGPEWSGDVEDFTSIARFALKRPDGQQYARVIASVSTVAIPPSLERSLQLDVSVRGNPASADIDGILAFHEMAHDQIVRGFTAITTESAHRQWRRKQA